MSYSNRATALNLLTEQWDDRPIRTQYITEACRHKLSRQVVLILFIIFLSMRQL